MKRFLLLLFIFLILGFTGGTGVSFATIRLPDFPPVAGRLDPTLRSLAESPEKRVASDVNVWTKGSVRRVSVLMTVAPGADLSYLTGLGVRINGIGPPLSAEVPLSQLARLGRWSDLIYAEAVHRKRLLLDKSAVEIGADRARTTFGRRGENVLIGVVDSGIDIRHPDFRNPDGTTRIKRLWDQTDESGDPPPDFPFGREYTEDEINQALLDDALIGGGDGDVLSGGHGSHVAGIAAGNGGGTPFVGVAPKADLIIVKWDSAHGLEANQYLMARAAEFGQPLVANNSWGGQNGPHDGTDLESQGLAALVGPDKPGRIITFAAGNDGDATIHAGGELQPGETGETALIARPGQAEIEIEVWADAASSFRYGLRYPATLSGQPVEVSVQTGSLTETDVTGDQPYEGAVIRLDARETSYAPNPSLQRCLLHVDLNDTQSGTLPGRNWTFFIQRLGASGSGRFDGWLTLDNDIYFSADATRMKADARKTLVNQACARNVITVGSYVLKTTWDSLNQGPVTEEVPGRVPGDPSPFSSQGPTRDGRLKPEIIAPGQWVASTLSGEYGVSGAQQRYVTPDGMHILFEGTSMASPHVAGTAALMLQADPSLTAPTVTDLLISSAKPTAGGWDSQAGFGKLDAFESVRRAVLRNARLTGDLNGDGKLDVFDVIRALKFATNLVAPLPEEIALCDVAPTPSPDHPGWGDGRITVNDVVRLLRKSIDPAIAPWPS